MFFLCCKDRFGNLLDLIFWYSNAFVMNLVVSLKMEWPHPPRTCQNTDGWLLRYLAVVYKLHFPWYFNLNKEWKVDEPLFVPKQNSKKWQQKQPVNYIDFQPTTAENCFQKMKEKKMQHTADLLTWMGFPQLFRSRVDLSALVLCASLWLQQFWFGDWGWGSPVCLL